MYREGVLPRKSDAAPLKKKRKKRKKKKLVLI